MHRLLVIAALLVALPAGAVEIEWVSVGDPGNAPDTATNCAGPNAGGAQDCGSVAGAYRISKYEVTNAQYVEFLNAIAANDTYGLYDPIMAIGRGGITRSGSPGSYATP